MLIHFVVKFDFGASWLHYPPFHPKQCWFYHFFDCTGHGAVTTLNWGARGIGELTLDANKIEQMLKYRKASFPKSVSTTFVTHCSSAGLSDLGSFKITLPLWFLVKFLSAEALLHLVILAGRELFATFLVLHSIQALQALTNSCPTWLKTLAPSYCYQWHFKQAACTCCHINAILYK